MELLLAIAIAAVLVTLGTVGSKSIRARADDVRCLGNLRQSGQAVLNYLNDRNGAFFPKKYWFQYNTYRPSSNRGMREYFNIDPDLDLTDARLHVDTILTCPAMIRRYPTLKDSAFRRGYGINYYLFQTVDEKETASFRNLRNVPSLPSMWVLADGALGAPLGAENPTPKEPLGSINDNTAYHAVQCMTHPHSGKRTHFFFFDGHVAGMTQEEIRDVPSRRNFWGSRDLSN